MLHHNISFLEFIEGTLFDLFFVTAGILCVAFSFFVENGGIKKLQDYQEHLYNEDGIDREDGLDYQDSLSPDSQSNPNA